MGISTLEKPEVTPRLDSRNVERFAWCDFFLFSFSRNPCTSQRESYLLVIINVTVTQFTKSIYIISRLKRLCWSLYRSRKEGERGLACIKGNVDASIQRLEDYIEKHERGLITAIRNDTDNTVDNRMTITRKQKWKGKQLYGSFKLLISNISHILEADTIKQVEMKKKNSERISQENQKATRDKTI